MCHINYNLFSFVLYILTLCECRVLSPPSLFGVFFARHYLSPYSICLLHVFGFVVHLFFWSSDILVSFAHVFRWLDKFEWNNCATNTYLLIKFWCICDVFVCVCVSARVLGMVIAPFCGGRRSWIDWKSVWSDRETNAVLRRCFWLPSNETCCWRINYYYFSFCRILMYVQVKLVSHSVTHEQPK